jgi:hypothetical protein
MKAFFHYFKLLLICTGIICLLPACSKYLSKGDGTKINRKAFIRITGVVPGTPKLIMVDEHGASADTFQAYSGQKIIWEIEDKTEIKSLDGFPGKKEFKGVNANIYRTRPGKRFLSKKWQGKLLVVTVPISEHYSIYWKDKKTGKTNIFDPLMQLNPTK